jgi:hypothetical protein
MSRTPTLPPTDRSMWRKLVARAHPDAGGDHELFIWAGSVRDLVCAERTAAEAKPGQKFYQPPSDGPARVPYPTGTDFAEATRTALRIGACSMPYGRLLSLLADCHPLDHLAHQQECGASYKRLAAIAHTWGLTKEERIGWYRVAEDIPLSDRHAGHILYRLKRRAA